MCLVDPNKFWPGFTLPQPGFSKTCWVHFPHNVYRRVVSLGLESQPNLCLISLGLLGPNKFWHGLLSLNMVSQKLVGVRFPQLHRINMKSRFTWPWEPNQVCALFPLAFWTQTNFDLGLLSLSLVSQKLVGYVSLSFTAPTCREESFHLALRT